MSGSMHLFIFQPGDKTKARDHVKIGRNTRFEPGNTLSGNFYFHRIGIDRDVDSGDYDHLQPARVLSEEIDWDT